MSEVSTSRLYVLRGMYLLIAVGLGITIWPGILSPPANLSHMASVVRSVLGAVSLLALLGLRYPLRSFYGMSKSAQATDAEWASEASLLTGATVVPASLGDSRSAPSAVISGNSESKRASQGVHMSRLLTSTL